MSNEAIWKTTTAVLLTSSGGSAASTSAIAPISAGTLARSVAASYPDCDLALQFSMASSVSAGSYIGIYERMLSICSTTSENAPSALYPKTMVAVIPIPNSSGTLHTLSARDIPLSPMGDTEFFIDPQCNSTLNAGWTLTATPKTLGPAA